MQYLTFISVIIGIPTALFTFYKAVAEYSKQGKKERADFFLKLRDRFKGNAKFMLIQKLVEEDKNDELEKIAIQDKNDLIGFFEELYLITGDGLLKKEVVFYMFGQYAIDCYNNPIFKNQLDFSQPYWTQFRKFCTEMEEWKKQSGGNITFAL